MMAREMMDMARRGAAALRSTSPTQTGRRNDRQGRRVAAVRCVSKFRAWTRSVAATLAAASLATIFVAPAHSQTASAQPAVQTVSHGLFSDVQVFRPAGQAQQFVLLLSANDTPAVAERELARTMTNAGAMVAFVPLAPFYRKLEAQDGKCTYAGGAFENLAHHVQAFDKLPGYLVPMLVGSGNAAAFAYSVLAQAPGGTFASGISLGFCPRLMLKTPLCAANALRWQAAADGNGFDLQPATALPGPWAALQAAGDANLPACAPGAAQAFVERVPQATWTAAAAGAASPTVPADAGDASASAAFSKAYARLAVKQAPLGPPPAQLADLPIVEAPVAANVPGSRFAVFISGDGGWAGLDKGIAAALVAQGVPVAGFDSLRYFWTARTPEGLATDLDRVIRYYAARWRRSDVILIGYSQGADVLPFAFNRLPASTRANVRLTALLGPGQKASFEFHVSNWIGPSGDRPIAPEAKKLSAATTLCIYGVSERDSLCPELTPRNARALALTGGHHFGGEYDVLAGRILEAMPR
ncbi:virulence factor family protein [soil metagenome]